MNNLMHKRRQLKTMGTDLSERDLLIHILGTLPKAYETTVDMAEKDLMAGSLTIESIRNLLQVKYQKIKERDNAVALITRQFKGTCRVCEKIGHKAIDFFTLPNNQARKEAYKKKKKGNNMSLLSMCYSVVYMLEYHVLREIQAPMSKQTARQSAL